MTGVNYYPAVAGWDMWTKPDPVIWQRDLLAARALGFDRVRVFLPVSAWNAAPGTFNFPTPTATQLANLTALGVAAAAVNIGLHLCLFDKWGSYGHVADSITWATTIAAAVSQVSGVELQNETAWSSAAPYTGGKGPADPTPPATQGAAAIAWAQQLIPALRRIFGKPVAVSAHNAPSADLAAAVKALTPDVFHWHCYDPQPDMAIGQAYAMTPNLVIGEFGSPQTWDPKQQVTYVRQVRAACLLRGLPEPWPWSLLDIAGDAKFGLLKADGTVKPAGRLYL